MQFDDAPKAVTADGADDRPWWRGLTRYQWFVFIVASLGWLFDTMDQQLFNLARISAVRELAGCAGRAMPRPWHRSTGTAAMRRRSS